MIIKDGVIMAGLQLQMREVLIAANSIWKKHGQELAITSGLDGVHSARSMHYYGYAVDLRTRYFDAITIKIIVIDLQTALGFDYYVLFEGNHIHVHYRATI